MDVIEEIKRFLSAGVHPTVAELGGAETLAGQADALVKSPFLDVLVRMFIVTSAEEKAMMQGLVLRAFAECGYAVALRDALDGVIEHSEAVARIVGPLQKILSQRVENRAVGSALISSYALEGLLRLALSDMTPRHRLLALLIEVERDEPGLFAANAAKLAGAAFHVWRENDLLTVLERLLDNGEAESEAAMELGLATLSQALAGDTLPGIAAELRTARAYFDRAYRSGEQRLDALAYRATIDVLEGFASGQRTEELSSAAEELEIAVRQRDIWRFGLEDLPDWMRPRLDREMQWGRLARWVRTTAGPLARPSWLNPAIIMDQVLNVYDAERTIGAGRGLSRLLRPPIEAAFVRERGLRAHLDDLLSSEEWVPQREVAEALRARLLELDGNQRPPGEVDGGASFPLLHGALNSEQAVGRLTPETAERLERALADRERGTHLIANPAVQRLVGEIAGTLARNEDYVGEVRANFNELTVQILCFCRSRLDDNWGTLKERGTYRFDPNASEWDLQNDLYTFLLGNFTRGDVRTEVSDVATGRADIFVTFGGTQFVIEMKKENRDATRGGLKKYLGQATSYQATNIRLGFLGVLDLSRREGEITPHLGDSVWVDEYCVTDSTRTRNIVVFRVAGNLPRPSSLSIPKAKNPRKRTRAKNANQNYKR
jgi:hypothetical protein